MRDLGHTSTGGVHRRRPTRVARAQPRGRPRHPGQPRRVPRRRRHLAADEVGGTGAGALERVRRPGWLPVVSSRILQRKAGAEPLPAPAPPRLITDGMLPEDYLFRRRHLGVGRQSLPTSTAGDDLRTGDRCPLGRDAPPTPGLGLAGPGRPACPARRSSRWRRPPPSTRWAAPGRSPPSPTGVPSWTGPSAGRACGRREPSPTSSPPRPSATPSRPETGRAYGRWCGPSAATRRRRPERGAGGARASHPRATLERVAMRKSAVAAEQPHSTA